MEFAMRYPEAKVMGIDISDQMLKIGLIKIERARLNGRILLQQSDLFHLPFKDEVFEIVSIAFGLRNLHDFRWSSLDIGTFSTTGSSFKECLPFLSKKDFTENRRIDIRFKIFLCLPLILNNRIP
jgi:hypothetical protein